MLNDKYKIIENLFYSCLCVFVAIGISANVESIRQVDSYFCKTKPISHSVLTALKQLRKSSYGAFVLSDESQKQTQFIPKGTKPILLLKNVNFPD